MLCNFSLYELQPWFSFVKEKNKGEKTLTGDMPQKEFNFLFLHLEPVMEYNPASSCNHRTLKSGLSLESLLEDTITN